MTHESIERVRRKLISMDDRLFVILAMLIGFALQWLMIGIIKLLIH